MFLSQYLHEPAIANHVKVLTIGHTLFRQGESGSTMFVILDGIVQLFDEGSGESRLIGTYGPGQFFGEKTLVKAPIQRFFTAQTITKTTVLEFSLEQLNEIQHAIPDFMVVLFQASAQRLERAYSLIRILQTQEPIAQLIHSILYFYRSPGLENSAGRYISLNIEDVQHLIRIDPMIIAWCFEKLCERGVLQQNKDGSYLLKDERGLIQAIGDLEQSFAA